MFTHVLFETSRSRILFGNDEVSIDVAACLRDLTWQLDSTRVYNGLPYCHLRAAWMGALFIVNASCHSCNFKGEMVLLSLCLFTSRQQNDISKVLPTTTREHIDKRCFPFLTNAFHFHVKLIGLTIKIIPAFQQLHFPINSSKIQQIIRSFQDLSKNGL